MSLSERNFSRPNLKFLVLFLYCVEEILRHPSIKKKFLQNIFLSDFLDRDFFSIGIDPSIGFWVSKIDTKNALGKMAMMAILIFAKFLLQSSCKIKLFARILLIRFPLQMYPRILNFVRNFAMKGV